MCAAADHPSRTRDGLLDTARALAILGIVYSHVVAGLRRADLIDHDTWWVAVNAILYQWRLPILALVVGLFIPHAVERDGASGYLRRRVSSFLWLYVVWFVILGLVTAALGDAANDDRGWTALVTPWRVDNHLWFLPHLVVSTTIVVLLRPWDSHRRRVWSLLISAALGLATWVVNPAWIGLRGMALVPFAVLGASWGWRTVASWVALRWRVLLAVLAGALAVRIAAYDAIVPPTLTNDAGIPGVWWSLSSAAE